MTDRIEELMATDQRRRDAWVAGDADALEAIVTDDFVYLHGSGFSEGKAGFIGRIRESPANVAWIKAWDQRVTDYGAFAIIEGLCDIPYHAGDGSESVMESHFVATWMKVPDGWHLAAYASTPRGAAPVLGGAYKKCEPAEHP